MTYPTWSVNAGEHTCMHIKLISVSIVQSFHYRPREQVNEQSGENSVSARGQLNFLEAVVVLPNLVFKY